MAVVECGHCGWTEEVPEGEDQIVLNALAMKAYAQHMWEIHPQLAPYDSVAVAWIETKAFIAAKSNGAVSKS